MDSPGSERYVQELYFLITKFLETGPCKKTFQALKDEIAEHKIIPKRLDWEGNQHDQTFEEWESKYPHIAREHLLEICQRIGPILDREISPCAPGVKTLLGAGSQSLLRKSDAVKKNLRLSEYIARHNRRSIYSPITCHNHNVVQVLFGQEISGPATRRHLLSPKFYQRTRLLNRALGHLTAVYCLLFDQTGKYIITGADDLLVKVWSGVDGRLLCTLRGASAEITDIAINLENTLLAAGSLDKAIRVWCLQTAFPVATLSAHTGMITGVNFCPNPFNGSYYLVSTSTDGSVAFWSYSTNPIIFQKKPVLYNEKIRPGQAQMICSSFSYGGAFLATGSADHHVRVYSMSTCPPQRIFEMEKHSDRVDSLLWANKGLKFISGSKDGTAIIWQYKARNWHHVLLDMATSLPGCSGREDESRVKLKVTMVSWSCDDTFAITAVNSALIKIWSSTGKLIRELTSHEDVVYVLESHPIDPAILLSAGHDGIIFLWDLRTGEQIFKHQNHIEGQGNGAIFDAKWSPDGTMMSATDSHGHLLIFGIAEYTDRMKALPKELFFHTDYRPLSRDPASGGVLDEQTGTPPHLMPPPFLVDIDGNPYPPAAQRLVPGREHHSLDQLIPHIVYTPGGQPEVVQFLNEGRSHLDLRIEELAQQSSAVSRQAASSLPRVVRRGGETESGRGPRTEGGSGGEFSWKVRGLVCPLSRGRLETLQARIKLFGDLELEEYEREMSREVELILQPAVVSSKKPKKKLAHNYRTRAARDSQTQQGETEAAGSEGDSSALTGLSDDSSSESSSSTRRSSSSTEYSDWVAEHSVNLEPPQRQRRSRRQRGGGGGGRRGRGHGGPLPPLSPPPPAVSAAPLSPPPSTSLPSTSAVELPPSPPTVPLHQVSQPSTSKKTAPLLPPLGEIDEIPELYRPSEWLSEVVPKKFPYYPQMGDEVMFFCQGYELYLKAVTDRKVYELAKSQLRPWASLPLQEPELVKVIGIKYELRPPRLCCLRLAVMKENGSLTGDRFTIKYHDIPDVIDFFVLKQAYDTAMMRNWKIGDRFRSMIDDGWWWGVIEGRRPDADSPFLCHRIRWDNGEAEDMSPWDMEPIDPAREPDGGGSVEVLAEEIAGILYHPRGDEWPGGDRETYSHRVISGLEQVMELSIAEPFAAPVDINMYKSYAMVVAYPIDLSTIKTRLENQFYRRLTAAQFDIRCIATNAEKFNEPHSVIVKNARIITDLCLKICKEGGYTDVPVLYRQLVETYESSHSEGETAGGDKGAQSASKERAAASRSLRALRRSNQRHHRPDWRRDCRQLLEVLWNCRDSEVFRRPVDRLEHPDYHKVVTTPIDLGQIREELSGENYSSPLEFCKDLRLMFNNSRQYNTNKRSKIYVMTVRLSALAEEHMKRIIKDWKSANRKQENPKLNGVRSRNHVKRKEESVESTDNESSDSSPEEMPAKPAYVATNSQGTNGPKRIKVLLPKANESSSSSADLPNNFASQGPLPRTRPQNMTKSIRFELSNEDSNEPVRPLRLRVPIMKKLHHFVSTSETDTSSQPSTSSGLRSLRAQKAVSYAENGEDSSTEEKAPIRIIIPYNMRRGSGLPAKSSPGPTSRVNYKEESDDSSGGLPAAPPLPGRDSSETEDEGLETVSEETGEEVRLNGVQSARHIHPPPAGTSELPTARNRSSLGRRTGRGVRSKVPSPSSEESAEESDGGGETSGGEEMAGEEGQRTDEDYGPPPEEAEDSEEEEAGASWRGQRPRTRPVRASLRSSTARRPRSKRKRKKSSDSSDCIERTREEGSSSGGGRRRRRSSRPRKRQNYSYDGDGGGGDSSQSEEDGGDLEEEEQSTPKISISSRGRVRKITPRARAYLMD